jgi:hypothetical protein
MESMYAVSAIVADRNLNQAETLRRIQERVAREQEAAANAGGAIMAVEANVLSAHQQ